MKQVIFEEYVEAISINEVDGFDHYGGIWPNRDCRVALIKEGQYSYYVLIPECITNPNVQSSYTNTFKTPRECMEYYHKEHGLKFYKFKTAKELLAWVADSKD